MKAILGTVALEPNRWTGKRNPKYSLMELLPLVSSYGFDKLEVWQWHVSTRYLKEIREVKAKADEQGLSFPYIGVYPSFILEGLERREEERIQADVLDKAEVLGTRTLKIMLGVGLKGSAATPELVEQTAERFDAWFREAKSRGISMTAELHAHTMFDPVDCGIAFMKRFPGLDFSICYQPYDFTDTPKALALADQFAGKISHIHLQAPQVKDKGGKYDLLEEAALDYKTIIPHILRRNPNATMTLEFVKECIQNDGPFNITPVLENARRDGLFVEKVLNDLGIKS